MPSERPGTRKANESSPGSTNERASFEQGYYDHAASRNEQPGGDPDVVLDVPVLKVDEIDLEVEDLRAHVSLRAELADLVKVNVGVDVYLDRVKLGIKGVEAQALLKVNLERILDTLDRAIEAVNRNPQILGGAARDTYQAEDTSQAARHADQGVERAAQLEGAADQAEGAAEQAVSNLFDEEGRTVRRAMDEPGSITETTLDGSGNVVDEETTGNLDDLRTEEAKGREVKATDAAERKARELGVRLSEVKGTGSGGRILVKDVEKAAR